MISSKVERLVERLEIKTIVERLVERRDSNICQRNGSDNQIRSTRRSKWNVSGTYSGTDLRPVKHINIPSRSTFLPQCTFPIGNGREAFSENATPPFLYNPCFRQKSGTSGTKHGSSWAKGRSTTRSTDVPLLKKWNVLSRIAGSLQNMDAKLVERMEGSGKNGIR